MADLTISVQNRMNVSGPSPTNKWGSFQWGERWGESGDAVYAVIKLIAAGTLSLSSDVSVLSIEKTISNTLSLSSSINFGTLVDGNGYAYVFPNNVTDLDSRYFPSWSESTEASTSYSEASEPSTTWTEA